MHAIRLAKDAAAQLDNNDVNPNDVDLPIAVRCDALADHRGGLAEAAVAELADQDSAMTLGLRQWLETRCCSGNVTCLLDAFDETPAQQRHTVSEMIDRQPNQDAKIIVTCRIANYSTGILRLRAAREPGYCGPRAIEPLRTLVNEDGDVPPELRENAIMAIAAIGGPEADEILHRLHSDTDAEITAATAAAESYSEPAQAIQHDSADTSDAPPDTPPDEQPDLVELLRRTTELLEDDLEDPDILTRGVAAIQLANSEHTAATAVLCEVLDHADSEFGKQVARALGRLGRLAGQQATEALIRALDNPDAHVTFLHEAVKAQASIDNNALSNWVITRNREGLNPNQIGPIYHHFRNKSCPPSLRPQLLSSLAEVTTRAERGTGSIS